MAAWQSALRRARINFTSLALAKPSLIRLKKPIVSFTFDDVPKSAWAHGSAILGRYGYLGTYYCSGGLLGKSHPSQGPYCDAEVIRSIIREGHEIGCHSLSHSDYRTMRRGDIERDMSDNRKLFAEEFGQSLTSFAYPFGVVTWEAKVAASAQYASARGIRQGINRYLADLAQLKATSLYSNLALDVTSNLIEATIKSRAWLIFYTHDVGEEPSPFGCTANEFEAVVKLVHGSGCEVLPIKNALGAIGYRD